MREGHERPRDRHHRPPGAARAGARGRRREELRSPEVQAPDRRHDRDDARTPTAPASPRTRSASRCGSRSSRSTGQPALPVQAADPADGVVNPVIEPVGDETVEINEGCLSVPGPARRRRPRCVEVRVRYLDRDGVAPTRSARAHRRHVPARGRPPRRDRCSSTASDPRRSRPGSSSTASSARVRGADRREFAAERVGGRDDAYWCEFAWLGGEAAEPDVADRGRRRPHHRGRRRASRAAGRRRTPCRAHHARPRQRPLARLPPRAARPHPRAASGSFWTWREQMYELAGALDPERYHRARPRDLRRDGAGRDHHASASSTTSTTRPAARPTTDPNAMGRARARGRRARPASGSRCSTPATCTAASASRSPNSSASATPAPTPGPSGSTRSPSAARSAVGAAIHSVRAVDPDARGDRRGVGGRARAPLHAHVSEQPAENEACLRRVRAHPDRAARGRAARSASASPRSTPPT